MRYQNTTKKFTHALTKAQREATQGGRSTIAKAHRVDCERSKDTLAELRDYTRGSHRAARLNDMFGEG
jgi:hypothetical protein